MENILNYTKLREELIRYEGLKYQVYLDSLGLPTAGIGHLLVGDEKKDLPVGTNIPVRQVEDWFAKDIDAATKTAQQVLGKDQFDNLDEFRQRLVVNLCFNLGPKFANFKKAVKAIQDKDFIRAASELQDSTWYKQVGRRGREMCEAMRQGYYSWE